MRLLVVAAFCLALVAPAHAQSVTLIGAAQFGDDHVLTRVLVRFEELVRTHYGKPVEFVLRRSSALGLERQYFDFMAEGRTVDYAIVPPVHMAAASRAAALMDAPFLFGDRDHVNKALEADVFRPVADAIAGKSAVLLIGYAGGAARNLYVGRPVEGLAGMAGLTVRVPAAPIWSRVFEAAGMAPVTMPVNQVHDALRKGTLAASESDAAGVESMKLHEIAPYLVPTGHAIAIRPICFSAKTFSTLPKDLQDAILKAGREAGAYGREIEAAEETQRLDALEQGGKLKRMPFAERAEMKRLADPVIAAYAAEIGAGDVLAAINEVK